jgi:hypothetical protein
MQLEPTGVYMPDSPPVAAPTAAQASRPDVVSAAKPAAARPVMGRRFQRETWRINE